LLGPKPFTLDRLLAIFAALYAEHAVRPEDLVLGLDDLSSEDEEDWALGNVALAQKRAERARAKEKELDDYWEEEVDHLTMSSNLWALVSTGTLAAAETY
jgi:origin recognition complex subunit 5